MKIGQSNLMLIIALVSSVEWANLSCRNTSFSFHGDLKVQAA